jgi:hypothetical protein
MRTWYHIIPGALLVAACSADRPTAASSPPPELAPSLSAVKFWDAGATVLWNAHAITLGAARAIDANRLDAYLGMAQHRAAAAADAVGGAHPPVSAAIGAASVVVLKAFFPADAALIESYLDAQESSARWPGAKHADFAAGEAIGRAVGSEVMAWAQSDRVGLTNPLLPPYGPVPLTPGSWVYNGGPIARAGLGARPFFLTSASQVRPAPPPTFGEAEFNAALAEVVQIATNRTAEQLAIANYWNTQQSPRNNAAVMAIAGS